MKSRRSPGELSAWQRAVPVYLSTLLQFAGVLCLAAYFIQPLWPHLWRVLYTTFDLLNLPISRSVFSFALYTVLAVAAIRRKRVAMWAVLILYQFTAILAVALLLLRPFVYTATIPQGATVATERLAMHPPWMDIIALVVALAMTALLIGARQAFPARVERHAWRRALATLLAGLLLSTLVAFALSFVARGTLHAWRGHLRWALQAALGVVPPSSRFGLGPAWLASLASAISLLGLIAALFIFVLSARTSRAMSADDELAVRRLLATSAPSDSLGYYATRREKSVTFSPDGRAAIAYRVLGGVAMASGDPVGDHASWPAAIDAWMRTVRSYGWTPAAISVSTAAARRYQAAGLRLMQMGDEAVVQVRDFSLTSHAARQLRHEVAAVQALGYTLRVRRQQDLGAEELAGLVRDADDWRDGPTERGFSMALGRFGDPTDGRVIVVTAHDRSGAVQGLLTFVPWGRRGLSLDLMRRSPHAAPGVTPFMVAGLLTVAGEHGAAKVSLNFAMFRHIFEEGAQLGAGPIDKILFRLARLASRRWQLESLYRSNERYLPEWVPRLMCYDRGANLAWLAITAAQLEGFLPSGPRLGRRSRATAASAVPGRPDPSFVAAVAELDAEAARVAPPPRTIGQQEAARLHKLARLRAAGMDPYPVTVPRTASLPQVRDLAARMDVNPALRPRVEPPPAQNRADAHGTPAPDELGAELSVAARVFSVRDHGGLIFATLREEEATLQLLLRRDETEQFALWRRCVDPGDIVSATGRLMRSRTGELTLDVASWRMATKSLAAMPDKRRGLTDPQAKLRLRHVDLATSDGARDRLLGRSAIVRALREQLDREQFVEVETPILQTIHGGANARPFRTRITAYATDLTLRIAPELALKKLAVGGVERVFELGRNFRNEGADATHNPEFTSLEAYQAYGDFTSMRLLTQRLIQAAARAVHGAEVGLRPDGSRFDLSGQWPVVDVLDAVSAAIGVPITTATTPEELIEAAAPTGVQLPRRATAGELVDTLYGHLVEPVTAGPTFYARFPIETSPLTRPDRHDPALAERWDLVANGMELGTAYSELIDPVDQRERLTAQSLRAAAGDPEAMELDESFLQALEFGMPPTGGLGLGVDRIVMLLLGGSIRANLAFPFLRPV